MSRRVGYEADQKWRINGFCAGYEALRTIGGTADQQLAACGSTRKLWHCDRVSGGVAVLMMQAADVWEGDDNTLV
jgi:hypothetical protein